MPFPSLSRRAVLRTVGGVFLGAAAYLRRPHWPGFFGGTITACPVEAMLEPDEDDHRPPDEYVTPIDDRLADLEPLQEALRRPCEAVAVSRREFGDAFTALEDRPVYDPYRHEGDDPSGLLRGIYVRDSDHTYLIDLAPSCSDAWWIDETGRPDGWSSC